MATFVLIEPDAFSRGFNAVGEVEKTQRKENRLDKEGGFYHNVRRPVRGIQIKDDTYATLQVRDAQGVPLLLFDAAADTGDVGRGPINSNFLLQQISEQRAEKQQIVQTFGEPYIFFFGEQPRIISVAGVLLNTEDFNWRAEWWENYDRFLRGTACVRAKTRVYLSWDDIVVEGYVVSASSQESSGDNHTIPFQFQMFLTNYQNISNIGDPNAHWSGKQVDLNPDDLELPSTGDQVSTTLAVRRENMISPQAFGQADSLLAKLRKGEDYIMNIEGQIVNTLNFVSSFISGRNIRVPIGFTGSAAYDLDVQLALASIPDATEVVTGTRTGQRRVSLALAGVKGLKEYSAIIGPMFAGYDRKAGFGPGLPLSANTDEFVARMTTADAKDFALAMSQLTLFDTQKVNEAAAMNKVRQIFQAYGIDVEPPKELYQIVAKVMFGIAGIGIGMNLTRAPGLRQVTNVLGAVI